jgi:hypothetical protein
MMSALPKENRKLFGNLLDRMKQDRRGVRRGEAKFGNLLERMKQDRKARRGEVKEKLLGYDEEDPDESRLIWETTIDGDPVEVIRFNIQSSEDRSTESFDKVPRRSSAAPPASRLKRGQRRASVESVLAQHTVEGIAQSKKAKRRASMESVIARHTVEGIAKSKKVKEAEDALPGSNQKRAQLRARKSFGDDAPSGPQKRAPPKAARSLDENEFRRKLVMNQIPYLPSEAEEGNDEPGMASNVPRTGPQSHSSPLPLPQTFRKGRRREDPPGGPNKRAPPKATKSLDEKEFRKMLVQNQIPYFPSEVGEGTEHPGMDFKVAAVNENSPRSHTSPPAFAWTDMPYLPSEVDEGNDRRAPPKAAKSLDENEFRKLLVQNPIPYIPSEVDEGNNEFNMSFHFPKSIEIGHQHPVSPIKSSRTALSGRSSSLNTGDDGPKPKPALAVAA